MTTPMADVVERLRAQASDWDAQQRQDMAKLNRDAAREIEALRARLSQAGAGGVVEPWAIARKVVAETLDQSGSAQAATLVLDGKCDCWADVTLAHRAVLAALAANPSAGEPVAWQWRHCGEQGWRLSWDKPFNPGIELKPLYTTPPATPVQPTASVEAVEPEMMEALYDKIEGLEADLESAVEVAFRRGAVEWTRLNYPTIYARLNAASLTAPAQGDVVCALVPPPETYGGSPDEPWTGKMPTPSSPVSAPSPAGGAREAGDLRRAIHEIVEWVEMEVDLSLRPALRNRIEAAKSLLERPALSSSATGEVAVEQAAIRIIRNRAADGPSADRAVAHARQFDTDVWRDAKRDARAALSNPAPGHGEGGL